MTSCLPSLNQETRENWEKRLLRFEHGLLHVGLADAGMRILVRLFHAFVCSRESMRIFLEPPDPKTQELEWARSIANWRWALARRLVFDTGVLRLIYGPAFLSRLPRDPSSAIDEQFREAAMRTPARNNSALWLTFKGTFPPTGEDGLPRYLRAREFAEIQPRLDRITTTTSGAAAFLNSQPAGSFNFISLSNIMDLAESHEAAELSTAERHVAHAAAPDATIVTRAIFPAHAPRLENPNLSEDRELSLELGGRDRSLICRHLTVYRRA